LDKVRVLLSGDRGARGHKATFSAGNSLSVSLFKNFAEQRALFASRFSLISVALS
jgi:hypothetical protein